MTKLIYGHDTLCGWCFGFIPTLEHFARTHPGVEIDVLPGGLVTGDRIQPYASMASYITNAEVNLSKVTGRSLGKKFHEMMNAEDTPMSDSSPPGHAVLQMKELASERVVEFAHALQEVHFTEGKDLNKAETYDELCSKQGFPALDTDKIVRATERDPMVAKSFARAVRLGIRSFPTILIVNDQDEIISTMATIYDPDAFVRAFQEMTSGQ
ncbi:MAG: DsbA family protein [Stappiaceae bacterium]